MLRHIQQAKSQPQTGMSFVHLGMLAVSTMTLRNNLDTEKTRRKYSRGAGSPLINLHTPFESLVVIKRESMHRFFWEKRHNIPLNMLNIKG